MASLEPPIPATTVDAFERPESIMSVNEPSNRFGEWRRTVGLLLLGVVVFLWTASNFLASAILADNTYSKAYFVTYFNTAFFILPLIPIVVRKAFRHPEELRQWRYDWEAWLRGRYDRVRQEDRYMDSSSDHTRRQLPRASHELLLGDPVEPPEIRNPKDYQNDVDIAGQLTLPETARLSLEFCFLWFLANYFIAACLEYTTVASSTILTSTSSVFTLVFGVIFGVEKFTVRKLIGVLASLGGIILISSVDLSGKSADDEHRGDFPEKSLKEIAIGDALAFMSAVMYGVYSVLMKKRIPSEEQINMPLFFGLVGLINVVLLWPGFFILHWTGVEKFQLPPGGRVTLILVSNSVASCVADLAWAYAVLLTSPIVVTVGLSMTIPLSLIGQIVLNSQTSSVVYWIGAIIVVLSFVFVNHEEKKEDQVVPPLNGFEDEQATTDARRS